MQVYFTDHANRRCNERGLDKRHLRSLIKAVPLCAGLTRFEIDHEMYAVFNDLNGIRHVITVYRKDERYENINTRPRRKFRRERGKRNDRMGDFREWEFN